MAGERELAAAIRAKVEELNVLIRQATMLDLSVNLDAVQHYRMTDGPVGQRWVATITKTERL